MFEKIYIDGRPTEKNIEYEKDLSIEKPDFKFVYRPEALKEAMEDPKLKPKAELAEKICKEAFVIDVNNLPYSDIPIQKTTTKQRKKRKL